MKEYYFNKKDIAEVNDKEIVSLKKQALNIPQRKIRLCLHKNEQDLLHEMVIVLCKGCYVRPHKHIYKTESFHILEGDLFLVIFDDKGGIIKKILMSDEDNKGIFLARIEKNYWHMIIPITDFVVFHETTNGPYKGRDDSIFASWAPPGSDKREIKKFISNLL